jgi:SAM-dependent methyltransferase
MCPKGQYKLIVGANAINEETRSYLVTMKKRKWIHELIISEKNLNKCPMMRKMFQNIDTKYIWWFDDDSYIIQPDAFDQRLKMAEEADENTVMWGHVFFFGHERDFSYSTDVVGFVKKAAWYKGLEPPSWNKGGKGEDDFEGRGIGDGRWFFITGGSWFIRTSTIKILDWPDPNLIKRNDDVFLCEAIRQQGWNFQDIGTSGVAINTELRRGEGEDKQTMQRQVGESTESLDLTGWFYDDERIAYQKMVSEIKNGKIVEVGVWKGLSLSSILDICKSNNNELYAIDAWLPVENDPALSESRTRDIFSIFKTNLKLLGHSDTVRVIRKRSLEAADDFSDNSLDLVFIDADHSYNAVIADIRKWWDKLKPGGILCGHDFTFKEGVCRAVTVLFHNSFELVGGSVWKAVKKTQSLSPIFLPGKRQGKGCVFIPTFMDSKLLEENYANRPEVTAQIDIIVIDDNHGLEETNRVKKLCSQNNWTYQYSNRSTHGRWQDHYHDQAGFNRFIWSVFIQLGKQYDYVIKMDTDAYIIEEDFFMEMDNLLYNRRAAAGTFEYRSINDVKSFWSLKGVEKYSFKPSAYVPHLQGGIYGLSKKALREIETIGFLEGVHDGFAEDGYISYTCLLLGIPLIPVTTTGSWWRHYLPELKTLQGLKAIHPMTRKKWEKNKTELFHQKPFSVF